MRMIGTVSNEAHAQRFSDHLLVVNVDAHIEESAKGDWQVWVEHDDHQDQAKVELQEFLLAPDDAKYLAAESAAQNRRKERLAQNRKRRAQVIDVRTSTAFTGLGRYGTPVILLMMAICFTVAIITRLGHDPLNPIFQALLYQSNPAVYDDNQSPEVQYQITRELGMYSDIRHGQIWRIVSPIFIHYGPLHLIFNMLVFWRFGSIIESMKGSLKTVLLILAIAIISCGAQAIWSQSFSPVRWSGFGGMSGVCGGLFGYAWMKHKYQPYERIHVSEQETWGTIAWFVLCSIGLTGNIAIANAAHWMGLATGVVIGIVPVLLRKFRR